jgi:hypothetical protein
MGLIIGLFVICNSVDKVVKGPVTMDKTNGTVILMTASFALVK